MAMKPSNQRKLPQSLKYDAVSEMTNMQRKPEKALSFFSGRWRRPCFLQKNAAKPSAARTAGQRCGAGVALCWW